jgi:hypothetical protein
MQGRYNQTETFHSFEQDFFEEIHSPLVAGLAEPEDRLFAYGGVGVGLGDFDEQRYGLVC